MGLIQDENNVPILYHVKRHAFNKTINYEPFINSKDTNVQLRYSMSLPKKDVIDKSRKNIKKYWWLDENFR